MSPRLSFLGEKLFTSDILAVEAGAAPSSPGRHDELPDQPGPLFAKPGFDRIAERHAFLEFLFRYERPICFRDKVLLLNLIPLRKVMPFAAVAVDPELEVFFDILEVHDAVVPEYLVSDPLRLLCGPWGGSVGGRLEGGVDGVGVHHPPEHPVLRLGFQPGQPERPFSTSVLLVDLHLHLRRGLPPVLAVQVHGEGGGLDVEDIEPAELVGLDAPRCPIAKNRIAVQERNALLFQVVNGKIRNTSFLGAQEVAGQQPLPPTFISGEETPGSEKR